MKTQIDELVEKKMGSDIQVKRNDFKTAIETLAKQMTNMAQGIDDTV